MVPGPSPVSRCRCVLPATPTGRSGPRARSAWRPGAQRASHRLTRWRLATPKWPSSTCRPLVPPPPPASGWTGFPPDCEGTASPTMSSSSSSSVSLATAGAEVKSLLRFRGRDARTIYYLDGEASDSSSPISAADLVDDGTEVTCRSTLPDPDMPRTSSPLSSARHPRCGRLFLRRIGTPPIHSGPWPVSFRRGSFLCRGTPHPCLAAAGALGAFGIVARLGT